jgi:large subunit ribosomal protein L11
MKMTTIAELIKQKLKVEMLGKPMEGGGRTVAGDLKMKDFLDISRQRGGGKGVAKMVAGTCLSASVTIEGKDPREIQKEIDSGMIKA